MKKMAYMERGTMTGQALRHLIDNSFSAGQGARPGVTKVGIVFTDGRSQDYIGDAAKKAKEHGEREKRDYIYYGRSRCNTKPTFTSQIRVNLSVLMPQVSRCTLLELATQWRTS